MRLVKISLFLTLLIIVFGALTYALNDDSAEQNTAMLNKPVPAFSLASLSDNNKIIDQQSLAGNGYKLLNVWASWCGVCKLEHDYLLQLAGNGVDIIGLNYRDNRKDALKVLNKDGNPYSEVLFDPDGNLALDLGVIGTPETFLIDNDGVIVKRISGVLDQQVWDSTFAGFFGK